MITFKRIVLVSIFFLFASGAYFAYNSLVSENDLSLNTKKAQQDQAKKASSKLPASSSTEKKNSKVSSPMKKPSEKTPPPSTAKKGSPAPAAAQTPTVSVKEGFERLQRGDLREAEDFFLEHVKGFPIDPVGHYGLGAVYRLEKDYDQSTEEFAKTLLLNPGYLEAKLQVAEMLTFDTKDDYETAETFYKDILDQIPAEKSASNGLATVYFSTGRVDDAIGLWEGLKDEMPNQDAIKKNLGNAYYLKGVQAQKNGNTDEARELMNKGLDMNPDAGPPAGTPVAPETPAQNSPPTQSPEDSQDPTQ